MEQNISAQPDIGQRGIVVRGGITDRSAAQALARLQNLNDDSGEEITLLINSTGGDVGAALRLYNALKFSSAPVIGIAAGSCDSAAALILQGCARKLALKNASFTLKPIFLKADIYTLDNAPLREKYLQIQREVEVIFSMETHMSHEEVHGYMAEAPHRKTFSAEEAAEAGLITGFHQ